MQECTECGHVVYEGADHDCSKPYPWLEEYPLAFALIISVIFVIGMFVVLLNKVVS